MCDSIFALFLPVYKTGLDQIKMSSLREVLRFRKLGSNKRSFAEIAEPT